MSRPPHASAEPKTSSLAQPSVAAPSGGLADDTDPDRTEQGRIGYGRLGRWSPVGLALLILVALGAIYVLDRESDDAADDLPTTTGELPEPRPAPAFELELLDRSGAIALEDFEGRTVVLNFWASWCGPCREEMPALQAFADANEDVVVVGVGAKTDEQGDAEAFVEEYGVTYPVGRDTEGGDGSRGAIERAYAVPGFPATYIITPDGMINQIVYGPVDVERLEQYVVAASE